MLFKKLYYYYHHYKMWNYIVGQLKAHPQASLNDIKIAYLGKINYDDKRYLHYNFCYLCSYDRLIRPIGTLNCISCPLCKKYNKTCFERSSLYQKVRRNLSSTPGERIAMAEKIRDCVLFWKNRRYKRNKNESN